MHEPGEITLLLTQMQAGDPVSQDRLMNLVYGELRRLAALQLRRERRDHSLQPSALVNEAYLRMLAPADGKWENRSRFFSYAAMVMRRVLVDHARARRAAKRGGAYTRVELDSEVLTFDAGEHGKMLALDEALEELAKFDARQAQVVEMRFFAGMTTEQIGDVMGLSSRTIKRDWDLARAWLQNRISGNAP